MAAGNITPAAMSGLFLVIGGILSVKREEN